MARYQFARSFHLETAKTLSRPALGALLTDVTQELGFQFFSLTHHVDFSSPTSKALRIHNYPEPWVRYFDEQKLGRVDPIHRASHLTACGFLWRDVGKIMRLSERDLDVLDRARHEGIADGFTIPAHVPGEARGSVSFAIEPGRVMPQAAIYEARLVGDLAFETARRLGSTRPLHSPPKLTERQLECVIWVARGKTDWEIARILGLSRDTVVDHLRHARERYETSTRLLLPLRALYDGSLCFSDIFP